MNINQGDPIRCNKCQSKFEAPRNMARGQFWGSQAARIKDEFCTCPTCGQTDVHWVYAIDIMPAEMTKRQINDWLDEN